MKFSLEQGSLRFVIIALLALVPYMQTTKFDFALDDTIFITKNPRVQNGLKDIPSLFENKRTGELQYKTGYRPILLLSYATDVQLFGMNPKAMHVMNVLLYTILCLLILKTLTEAFSEHRWVMFLVTVLFTVHPLHVEGVANIKGRDEILALLFGVLFIWLQVRYLNTTKIWLLLIAPFVYLLSVLCKESAIVFAGVALGLWFLSSGLSIAQRILQAVSSVAALVVMFGVRTFVYSEEVFENKQQELEQMGTYHWDGFIGNPLFDVHDFPTLLANAFNIIYQSVKLFFIPFPLVHDYSYNHFPLVDWSSPETYFGVFIVVFGAAGFIYSLIKKKKYLTFGLIWFFATISVYLSLVRPATDIFAERFLFTPSLGLTLISLAAITAIPKLEQKHLKIGIGIWSAILLVLTVNRCPAWKDTETLMETDIDNLQDCVRANYNYALFLHQRYDNNPRVRNARLQQDILMYYNRALTQSDRLANLYIALGNAYMRFGMPDRGVPVFREAVRKYPDLVKPGNQLGMHYYLTGRFDSAVYYFRKALSAGKSNSEVYMKLGLSLYENGDYDEALEVFKEGEEYAKGNLEYYQKYITVCIKLNKLSVADQVTRRAYELFPTDPSIADYHAQFQKMKERSGVMRGR